ncbi:unnamed protein product [Oppiella nova]|uniref:Uncharacterized protein n=1 Tax=Oppiella nova TaxID=334625 RepID=A0A7R9QN37_9ACAR|nr:unnamed protein product [Oppiella nova]CAG2169126.1 unnamed protein product [Oppiella nova]
MCDPAAITDDKMQKLVKCDADWEKTAKTQWDQYKETYSTNCTQNLKSVLDNYSNVKVAKSQGQLLWKCNVEYRDCRRGLFENQYMAPIDKVRNDMPLGVDSSLKAQVCDSNVINDEKIQKMIACDQNWTKQQKPILTDYYKESSKCMVNNSAIEPAKFNVKVYMNMIQLVRLCGGTYNEKLSCDTSSEFQEELDPKIKAKMCDPHVMSDEKMDQMLKCDHQFHQKWEPTFKKLGEQVAGCAQKSHSFVAKFGKLHNEQHRHEVLDTCDANYAKCRHEAEKQIHDKLIRDICVRGHEEHGLNDFINKPNKAKMCDPGVMSDALAVKLDKCDESYSTAVEKEIEKFENLYHDCEKKETEFFAKFKKLRKEENQHHLHHTCDELSDKCYDSYFAKLNEVGIKHKKSLNDCYSKVFGA